VKELSFLSMEWILPQKAWYFFGIALQFI